MIKVFVAAGLGVSLISESFARDEVRISQVKLIPDYGYGSLARGWGWFTGATALFRARLRHSYRSSAGRGELCGPHRNSARFAKALTLAGLFSGPYVFDCANAP